eukprot:1157516-Pelagomonas_calceolata.AAC.5
MHGKGCMVRDDHGHGHGKGCILRDGHGHGMQRHGMGSMVMVRGVHGHDKGCSVMVWYPWSCIYKGLDDASVRMNAWGWPALYVSSVCGALVQCSVLIVPRCLGMASSYHTSAQCSVLIVPNYANMLDAWKQSTCTERLPAFFLTYLSRVLGMEFVLHSGAAARVSKCFVCVAIPDSEAIQTDGAPAPGLSCV